MVFTQLLKQVTDVFNESNKKACPASIPGAPELRQGRTYLRDKRNTLNTIKPFSPLLEGLAKMDDKPLDSLNQQEWNKQEVDRNLLTQKLSKYGRDTKAFYDLYGKVAAEVATCRKSCGNKFEAPAMKYQKQACLVGCNLNLPSVANEKASFAAGQGNASNVSSCSALKDKAPQYCKSWNQTLGCSKDGPLDAKSAFAAAVGKDCNTTIPSTASGYCLCSDGSQKGLVDCGHPEFNCNEACAPTSKGYTYTAPPQPCGPNDVPQLISCSKPGYCYNALTGESVSTYLVKGDPYPSNRKIGGRSYYFRKTGRGAECPASSYTAPFCANPTYKEFIAKGCSQANTAQTCEETVNAGWTSDSKLCKTVNKDYKQPPCYIDPVVAWVGNDIVGNYAITKANPQGVRIPNQDVGKLRGSAALYYYTAPPTGESLIGTSILKSVTDGAGNLYLFLNVSPPSFVTIPYGVFDTPGFSSNASCFKDAKIFYAGPKPGTKYTYNNNYRHVGGNVGGWGGGCRCPDGTVYVVGDHHNHCGSLACEGGAVVSCGKNGAKHAGRSGWAVTCDPGPIEGFAGMREGLSSASLRPAGGQCTTNSQCATSSCDTGGLYKDQASGTSCKNRCVDSTRTKCPSLGNSIPAGLSAVPTGADLVGTCKGAFPYPDQSAQLAKDLNTKNEDARELLKIAEEVQTRLDSAHQQLNAIGGGIPAKTQRIRDNLKSYRRIYDKLRNAKQTDVTLTAMQKDGELNVGYTSFGYYIWLILAISLLIAAIRQLKN